MGDEGMGVTTGMKERGHAVGCASVAEVDRGGVEGLTDLHSGEGGRGRG